LSLHFKPTPITGIPWNISYQYFWELGLISISVAVWSYLSLLLHPTRTQSKRLCCKLVLIHAELIAASVRIANKWREIQIRCS